MIGCTHNSVGKYVEDGGGGRADIAAAAAVALFAKLPEEEVEA